MKLSLAFPLAAAITATVIAQSPTNGIVRLDPALDAVVPASAKAELIISPQGRHLGTIVTPERVANLAFGDADSRTLYMVGGRSLWRIRVNIAGIRPVTKEKR
jgi:hypothetical protein